VSQSSHREPPHALPRRLPWCTPAKQPQESGTWSCAIPRCGRRPARRRDHKPAIGGPGPACPPSPSSSRASAPRRCPTLAGASPHGARRLERAAASVSTPGPGASVAWLRGLMGRGWTFSRQRRTASPPRWSLPHLGGCSGARVPRPRCPWRRRRRPRRPVVPRPQAAPGGLRPWKPPPMPPRRGPSERASCAPGLGVTDRASAARRLAGDRVRGPWGGSTGCAPGHTGPVSTRGGAADARHSASRSPRPSVARRPDPGSAAAQGGCPHVLAASSHHADLLDTRDPLASVGRGRSHTLGRRR